MDRGIIFSISYDWIIWWYSVNYGLSLIIGKWWQQVPYNKNNRIFMVKPVGKCVHLES